MGKLMVLELAKFVLLAALITSLAHQRQVRAHEATKAKPGWAKTVVDGKERRTEMQLYLHETITGESPTAIEVVRAPGRNQTFTGFGYIAMVDDPLKVGADPNSKLVGRAQGLDGGASQDGLSLITTLTCTFSEGMYNGSSLSIMGVNSILEPVRELSVVGGTALFRMARGFDLLQTYSFNISAGTVIVLHNLTIFH